MTTTAQWKNPHTEERLLAALSAKNTKITPAARSIARILPTLTRDELEEFWDWAIRDELVHRNPSPEKRRELLSKMDVCPCCDRWLGHNKPPADDDGGDQPYRRQPSFGF